MSIDYYSNEGIGIVIDDFFSEDEDIIYHAGGNFVSGRQLVHMFVCPGQTLKEQIENIPKFLQAMNKYIPLTEDELNTVSVWSVM